MWPAAAVAAAWGCSNTNSTSTYSVLPRAGGGILCDSSGSRGGHWRWCWRCCALYNGNTREARRRRRRQQQLYVAHVAAAAAG